jgi:hypothetical protein
MMTENKKTAKAFSIPSPAQQKWTAVLAWIADSIDFLGFVVHVDLHLQHLGGESRQITTL